MENQTNPTRGDNATRRIVIAELRAIADETDRLSDGSHPQWVAAYRAAALDVAKRLPPVPYRCQHNIACSDGRHSVACEDWNLEARITHAEQSSGDRYRLAWLSARRRARFAADVVDAEVLCGAEASNGAGYTWQCELPDGHDGSHWGHYTRAEFWQ